MSPCFNDAQLANDEAIVLQDDGNAQAGCKMGRLSPMYTFIYRQLFSGGGGGGVVREWDEEEKKEHDA